MFAWQNHSQDHKEVPPYTTLLEFIDLRARVSENTVREDIRKRTTFNSDRKSYTKSLVADIQADCVACKAAGHPLNKCKDFCALSHNLKMGIIKENGLCMNCLRLGHLKNCPSTQRCKECRKPHHSLLHIKSVKRETKPSSGESFRQKRDGCFHPCVAIAELSSGFAYDLSG